MSKLTTSEIIALTTATLTLGARVNILISKYVAGQECRAAELNVLSSYEDLKALKGFKSEPERRAVVTEVLDSAGLCRFRVSALCRAIAAKASTVRAIEMELDRMSIDKVSASFMGDVL